MKAFPFIFAILSALSAGVYAGGQSCDGDLSLLSQPLQDELIEIIKNLKDLSIEEIISILEPEIEQILLRNNLDDRDRQILYNVLNGISSGAMEESTATIKFRIWSCFFVYVSQFTVIDAPKVCPPGTKYGGGKCRPIF